MEKVATEAADFPVVPVAPVVDPEVPVEDEAKQSGPVVPV